MADNGSYAFYSPSSPEAVHFPADVFSIEPFFTSFLCIFSPPSLLQVTENRAHTLYSTSFPESVHFRLAYPIEPIFHLLPSFVSLHFHLLPCLFVAENVADTFYSTGFPEAVHFSAGSRGKGGKGEELRVIWGVEEAITTELDGWWD